MLGEYEGSGYKEPPFMVRRVDGQVIQLPRPLYAILEAADGSNDYATVAERVTEAIGRRIEPDDVAFLVEKKLRPLGVLAGLDGSAPRLRKPDPLLALQVKKGVIPAGTVRAITAIFRPFFFPPVVVAALGGLVAFDAWLFGSHGIAQSVRQTLHQPGLLILLIGMVILAAALHECGHATACAYGGAKPGEMGVGLYVVWPVFYTDVTDSYRLGRAGRLRTDLGGIYFNALFVLALAGAYLISGFEFLLIVIFVQHLAILQQLLPFLRFDGYYVIADLTGVPDMFARIKPILAGLVPWRKTDDRVRELKWWARAVVTVWVLTIVPVILYVFAAMVVHMPRIFATAWDSLGRLSVQSRDAFGRGDSLAGAASVAQMIVLCLPVAAIAATTTRVGRRVVTGGLRRTEGRPLARAGLAAMLAVAVGLVAYVWRPDEDYRPIQPGERWTVQDAAASFVRTARGDTSSVPEQAERATTDGETSTATESETDAVSSPDLTSNSSPVPDGSPAPDGSVSESEPEPSPDGSSSPESSPSPSGSPTAESSMSPTPSPSAT